MKKNYLYLLVTVAFIVAIYYFLATESIHLKIILGASLSVSIISILVYQLRLEKTMRQKGIFLFALAIQLANILMHLYFSLKEHGML